jgi:hypothetical protein
VFLEAHGDTYHRARMAPLEAVRARLGVRDVPPAIDWTAVAAVLRNREGTAQRVGGAS